jgi:hypothetical protein
MEGFRSVRDQNLSLVKNASEPKVRLFQCFQRINSGIWNRRFGHVTLLRPSGQVDFVIRHRQGSVSPNTLWPPDHKLVPVVVNYAVNDDCDPAPVCLLSVTDNEPGPGGIVNPPPDWKVQDAHDVDLRAETSGRAACGSRPSSLGQDTLGARYPLGRHRNGGRDAPSGQRALVNSDDSEQSSARSIPH